MIVDFSSCTKTALLQLKTAVACVKIFAHHYPDRLHTCICWRAPKLVHGMWLTVQPLISARTARKIIFLKHGATGSKTALQQLDSMCVARCHTTAYGFLN